MKKKFLNKLLILALCASFLSINSLTVKAEEISKEEASQEISEEELEDEFASDEEEADTQDETDTQDEESGDSFDLTSESDTSNGLYIDDVVYEGNVWVDLNVTADENASLTSGTEFIVTFESLQSSYKKEVTLSSKNGFNASVELPVDEYYVYTKSMLNGKESNAKLVFNSEEENQSVLIKENGQKLDFTLKGDVVSEETTEEVVEEEKEVNPWLDFVKNNLIFGILLFGLGMAAIVYKIKQDNQ